MDCRKYGQRHTIKLTAYKPYISSIFQFFCNKVGDSLNGHWKKNVPSKQRQSHLKHKADLIRAQNILSESIA